MTSHLVCIAPMMDYTDRHARYFLRIIAPHVRLYTEMVTAAALAYGDADHLLRYNEIEHPIALQLGGNNVNLLKKAAILGKKYGYDEINLNVGCPSNRVKSGDFGACLMLKPQLVADCIAAMKAVVDIPVTIKCRIGVDNHDSYQNLHHFVATTHQAGCEVYIIHARKAWLQGLSPKQNREIPPLHYDYVYQLKKDFPHLTVVINGGIQNENEVVRHLNKTDGVMLGRQAYHNPYMLTSLETILFANSSVLTREEIIHQFTEYMIDQLSKGVKLSNMTRHVLGLFQGERGARIWRRYISQNTCHPKADGEILSQALLEQKMRIA